LQKEVHKKKLGKNVQPSNTNNKGKGRSPSFIVHRRKPWRRKFFRIGGVREFKRKRTRHWLIVLNEF